MISVQRRPNGEAFIAGGRLNVCLPEWRVLEEFSVGHAVERASACDSEFVDWNYLVQVFEGMKEDLLEAGLQSESQVHVALGDFCMWFTRIAEQFLHSIREMPRQADRAIGQDLHALIAPERLEISQIQLEGAVLGSNDLADLVAIPVLAIWRKAHHFTFVTVFRVADELADHGVKAAQRVRQKHALQYFNGVALAAGHHRGNKIPGAVITKTRSLLPRRAKISAGNMSYVMLEVMFLEP